MGQDQKTDLLRSMLQQVGANDGRTRVRSTLESRATGRDVGPGADVRAASTPESAYAAAGLEALELLERGEIVDADKRFALEAIVMPLYRPVVDIVNDQINTDQLQETWSSLGTEPREQWNRQKIRSVGRINVPGVMYAGTGFVVGPNLLMTNRHVAAFFAQGMGTRVDFQAGQTASIGFCHEKGSTKNESLNITKVVMIHPFWDMAILEVSGLSHDRTPLVLDTTDPEKLVERKVVVIGYPGYDPSDDPEFQRVQERIFRGTYYVKRFQPGILRGRRDVKSYERMISAVTHDCSTLGGNSGSAVIDIESGTVVGLHFAGAYLDANYAVSPFDLAADPRVATLASAGVQFSGRVEPRGDFYGPLTSAWSAVDRGEKRTDSKPAPLPNDPNDQSLTASTQTPLAVSARVVPNDAVTFSIPLHVSISLGKPVLHFQAATKATESSTGVAEEGQSAPSQPAIDTAPFQLDSLSKSPFTWKAALSLALASKLAYESDQSVKSTCHGSARSWGFDSSEFIDEDDTQCFVALSPQIALVAFRGTESRGDWLKNINVPGRTREYGVVHRGFLGAFQSVESRLRSALSDSFGRKLILTGHSLGGALATVMAAEWQDFLPAAWVITFGQPAVGSGAFRMFFLQHYSGKFFRFVNRDDVVPRVPPGYEHVGRLLHFDVNNGLRNGQSLPVAEAAVESVNRDALEPGLPMLTAAEYAALQSRIGLEAVSFQRPVTESNTQPQTEGLLSGFSDHSLDAYIARIVVHAKP